MRHLFSLWLVVSACAGLAFWLEGMGRPVRGEWLQAWGLSVAGLAEGHWWTWLTYGFLHGSWWHLAMNLLSLWVVGRHACREWGQAGFLAVLGAGTVAGGLVQMALSPAGVLVGISGGVFSLLVATALAWGDRRVSLGIGGLRFGVLSGRSLGVGCLAATLVLAAATWWWPERAGMVGHACHAGGALAGAGCVGVAALARRFPARIAGRNGIDRSNPFHRNLLR